MKTPMIKDLSNEALVQHYIGIKQLAYNGAACKSRNLGWLLKQLDITVAVARKRGVQLPA